MNTKTVFVLGAGASAPYGFPLGNRLINLICSSTTSTENGLLEKIGFNLGEVNTFIQALRHSGYYSVDWFLEKRPEYITVGKALIAIKLIPFEDPRKLFPPYDALLLNENWYQWILNRIIMPTETEVNTNSLAFITFNYDRSLEYYLYKTMEERFRSGTEAINALRKIEIIHVHGSLGDPWYKENTLIVQYSPDLTVNRIQEASRNITIIHEANPSSQEFRHARAVLDGATRISFLGFGYHPESINRLGVFRKSWNPSDREKIMVTGTAKSIPPQSWREICQNHLNGAISTTQNCDHTVYQHLTRYFPL